MDNLSFTLQAGQTLALVGESGSGKSTVVRALAQLVRRSSGEILLDGAPAGRHGRALRGYRHRVQLIFQDPFASLNPMHTVRAPPGPAAAAAARAAARRRPWSRRCYDLLRSVNLTPPEEVAGKHPHELSGGQRQRVAIARALATDPDVLLADEPVSMLDVSIRLEILNLLDRLKRDRNLAMLYVTHDLATARHFSAEIMVMYRGEIVEHGPSDEVILQPGAPVHPDPGRRRARSGRLPPGTGHGPAGAAGGPGRADGRDARGGARRRLPVPRPVPARDAGVPDQPAGRADRPRAPCAVLALRARRRGRAGPGFAFAGTAQFRLDCTGAGELR